MYRSLPHCLGVGVSASAPVRKEIRVAALLLVDVHIVCVAHVFGKERRLVCLRTDAELFPCSQGHSHCYAIRAKLSPG